MPLFINVSETLRFMDGYFSRLTDLNSMWSENILGSPEYVYCMCIYVWVFTAVFKVT